MNVILLLSSLLLYCAVQSQSLKLNGTSPAGHANTPVGRRFLSFPEGVDASIKCKANGTPPLKVQWYKSGKLVTSSGKRPRRLRLRKLQVKDSGTYKCVVSSKFGVTKQLITVQVLRPAREYAPILVEGYPKNKTVLVGDTVSLQCLERYSESLTDYRWHLSKTVPDDENYVLVSPAKSRAFKDSSVERMYGSRLTLVNVTKEDEGFYTCYMTNHFGSVKSTSYLTVNELETTGAPKFAADTPKEMIMSLPAGYNFSLKCKANGTSPLKVQWYKDGKLLTQQRRKQPWKLRIKETDEKDRGLYACVVSNKFGSVKRSFNVDVIKISRLPPVMVKGFPKNKTVLVGDTVSLQCLERDAHLLSDYRWLKSKTFPENVTLVPSKTNVLVNPAKYLSINEEKFGKNFYGVRMTLTHVKKEDQGFYTCFITNSVGSKHSTSYLTVNEMNKTDPPEFLVSKHERQQYFVEREGDNLTLTSLVRGGSPLKYRWYLNGQIIKADEHNEIHDGELILRRLSPSQNGKYTCVTSNAHGKVKQHFKVRVFKPKARRPMILKNFLKDKTARPGESTKLYCIEKGNTNTIMDYRWLKWHDSRKGVSNKDLKNKTLYTVLNAGQYEINTFNQITSFALRLKNLTKKDEGLYTCLVSNLHGYVHRSASLFVKEPSNTLSNDILDYPVARQIQAKQRKATTVTCYKYQGDTLMTNNLESHGKCNTTQLCASFYDHRIKGWNLFCDESRLCRKHGLRKTGCKNVTLEDQLVELCCCSGGLCNKPKEGKHGRTSFANDTKPTAETSKAWKIQKSKKFTTFLFLTILLVTIVLMLGLILCKVRQRKSRTKIVQDPKKKQKLTEKIIMETKWLKENA